jgi:hypothetical protein
VRPWATAACAADNCGIVELWNRRIVELKNEDQRMTEITNLIALIPADIESLEEVRVKYHLIEEQEG